MTDSRSPISHLISKYCSAKVDISDDPSIITKLFTGNVKYQYDHATSPVYRKDSTVGGSDNQYDIHGFNTNVEWIDTIAYGNNYLDGNYRRDEVGNNKSNPIVNTLDTI